jgi:molecular chaperone Hsp33
MKNTPDTLSRVICDDLNLRAYTVTCLHTARAITALHETTPNATVALGRCVTATALLSAMLKSGSRQSVSVKFSGSGPLKEVHVQADTLGNIRGYVAEPRVDETGLFENINFSRAIGAGFLTVIRDTGHGEPYTGIIPLPFGDVAADMTYYLTASEQVPSAVILGLTLDGAGLVASSGGILIQTFPGTDGTAIDLVEKNTGSMKETLGDMLREGRDIYEALSRIFDKRPLNIVDSIPLHAACRCSKELLCEVLPGIPEKDLLDMREKDGGAEAVCTFCKKTYFFDAAELDGIIAKKKRSIH